MAKKNEALEAEEKYKSNVEKTAEYVEFFDILETINNVGNDEVFTPRKVVDMILDSLPNEVWHNPNYRWLNPATKTGIFEREVAIRLDEGLMDEIPNTEARRKHILQNMIFSIGQTKFTANVARRTLYYCCQANRSCDGIMDDGHYVNGYAIGNGTWFSDAEGNIKTPCTNHQMNNKKKCIYCGMSEDSKYLDANQREKYSYDFIHCGSGSDLQKYLSKRFFEGDETMKFDVIIGNPPYQLNDGGNGSSATPIYHKFVSQAKSLDPKYISMIIPARWFSGGKGLDDFREEMINDVRIQKLTDYPASKDCFSSGIEVKGGVCYFLWNRDYSGDCTVTTMLNGTSSTMVRPLREKGSNTFIRFNEAIPIYHKVVSEDFDSFKKYVSSRRPFGFQTNYRGRSNFKEGDCKIYVKNECQFVKREDVVVNPDWIDKYKIYISKAYGAGEDYPHQIINVPFIGESGSCCNETYLVVGPFDSESLANNVISYMKTKFFRFMVMLMKNSQDATRNVYTYVPNQDFSIRWNDEMLYAKYGLNQMEIEYIESMIKEMI